MNLAARLIPLVPGPRPSSSSDAKYLTSLSNRDFTSGKASPRNGITAAVTSPSTPTINASTRIMRTSSCTRPVINTQPRN